MTTVTIQRNILLNMIASEISILRAAERVNGLGSQSGPLITYMRKLHDDLKTATLVAVVTDDIIQDYTSGPGLEVRQGRLVAEIQSNGAVVDEQLMTFILAKP